MMPPRGLELTLMAIANREGVIKGMIRFDGQIAWLQ